MELESHAIGKDLPWNFDAKVFFVLLALLTCSEHHLATVGDDSVHNCSDRLRHTVETLVCAADHHLVPDDFLGAENDAVLAHDAQDGAGKLNQKKDLPRVFDSLFRILHLEDATVGRQRVTLQISLHEKLRVSQLFLSQGFKDPSQQCGTSLLVYLLRSHSFIFCLKFYQIN